MIGSACSLSSGYRRLRLCPSPLQIPLELVLTPLPSLPAYLRPPVHPQTSRLHGGKSFKKTFLWLPPHTAQAWARAPQHGPSGAPKKSPLSRGDWPLGHRQCYSTSITCSCSRCPYLSPLTTPAVNCCGFERSGVNKVPQFPTIVSGEDIQAQPPIYLESGINYHVIAIL